VTNAANQLHRFPKNRRVVEEIIILASYNNNNNCISVRLTDLRFTCKAPTRGKRRRPRRRRGRGASAPGHHTAPCQVLTRVVRPAKVRLPPLGRDDVGDPAPHLPNTEAFNRRMLRARQAAAGCARCFRSYRHDSSYLDGLPRQQLKHEPAQR